MRVLVTGGAGFIGSHIVDQLIAHGHQPAVVDDLSSGRRENLPSDVPLYEIDVCDQEKIEKVFDEFRPEAVCHQAAQMSVSRSVREPGFDAKVNLLGLIHVLDSVVRVGAKRVVFASSGGVLYGDVFEPADESHPANPISPYGISKWGGERYLDFYAKEHKLETVALRYSNVYGPRQNPHGEAGVVAIFCQKLLAGEPATINGDGKFIRDYVFAIDVARANLSALTKPDLPDFTALNIGTGQGTDVNELEEQLRKHCDVIRQSRGTSESLPEPIYQDSRPGDLRSSLVDADLAGRVLDWRPTVTLTEGLRQTSTWFAENSQ